MLDISEIQVGKTVLFQDEPCQVLERKHLQLGRGSAVLNLKLKNLKTGSILLTSLRGAQKLPEADLEKIPSQFLYSDENFLYFMNLQNFEQFKLPKHLLGDLFKYISEGRQISILAFKNEPLSLELPPKVKLRIEYTEKGFKGDTVSAASKPATLETGAKISVPLFVKIGDEILVDTRNGKYLGRA